MLGLVAEMHRTFMGRPVPHLATAEAHVVFLTPATAAREPGCEVFLRVIERGAELLPSLVDSDLVDAIHAIVADPTPLADELRSCGTTLAHGDVRYPNIGLVPEGIVLIDWGLATLAPPALDLAFFLSSGLSDVDVTREQAIEDIRAIWADLVDDRAFGLGLLAEAVGTIWFEAMRIVDHADERERARSADELEWWSARARDGLERYWSPV
jgi:thiamine kinase-like enzyme